MDYKIKETLTKAIIKQDIKAYYLLELKMCLPATIFCLFGLVILWFACDLGGNPKFNPPFTVCLILYILLTVCVSSYFVYTIVCCCRKNIKYSIISDTFTHFGNKYLPGNIFLVIPTTTLFFSKKCYFILHFHRRYYQWSKHYHDLSRNYIIKNSTPGDKFYLIIRNGKILNLYNQKMFALDDSE